MSILVIGTEAPEAEAVITRLVGQGDEVRVIEPDERAGQRWRALGAHVARGQADDPDLVERAAQNVRTVVLLSGAELGPILPPARAAGVGRVVACVADAGELDLEGEGMDFVLLLRSTRRWPRRSAVGPVVLAEAIDAADDLPGNPRMIVDLDDVSQWGRLGLEPPAGKRRD